MQLEQISGFEWSVLRAEGDLAVVRHGEKRGHHRSRHVIHQRKIRPQRAAKKAARADIDYLFLGEVDAGLRGDRGKAVVIVEPPSMIVMIPRDDPHPLKIDQALQRAEETRQALRGIVGDVAR